MDQSLDGVVQASSQSRISTGLVSAMTTRAGQVATRV